MQNAARRGHSEQGAALVLTIISLLIITGLAAAMLTSARTETLIARNEERAVHARTAAEAGLNHGLEVAIDYVRDWQSNGFANAEAAITDLLNGPDNAVGTTSSNADNGSLEAFGLPRPPTATTLSASLGTRYVVRVYDEDDSARGLALSMADVARIGENAVATTDGNKRIVVQAIGYGPGGTVTTLEATVGPLILPAVVTNGNLTISGSPSISGANGSVHSNNDLIISGSPNISENCTSSGTYSESGNPTCGGYEGGGRQAITVPPVRASDYLAQVDFILHSDGRMTNQPETMTICNASADNNACRDLGYGWVFQGATGWAISGNSASGGAYYVEGDALVSGSPGSPSTPVSLSIIAEGNIEISGNPDLRPDLPETLFVTDKDLKISGGLETPINIEGQILVHEQISISGNPFLAGQIIVENAAHTSNLVTSNTISGHPTIVYNGLVGSNTFAVSAWREVR
jgi:Tfp pilus assembly protein PilX/cytoskeletal protein CcmA (bactofilin family)